MLILVAVTVNLANENGGLFEKARYAKSETAAKAEEEELTMYMFGEGVYNAKTGKVDLDALGNLLTDEAKWKNVGKNGNKLVVTGTESGKGYIIDEKGTISELKDGEDQPSTGILGTYHGLGELYFSGNPTLKFDSDGQATKTYYADEEVDSTTGEIYKGDDEVSTGPYTYDETTKTGTLTLTDYSSPGYEYTYEYTFSLISLNNNVLIELIEHGDEGEDDQWVDSIWAKNKCGKITDLGTSTYVNGTTTMEFGTSVEDGVEMGIYTVKRDGSVLESIGEYYICYNGKLVVDGQILSISDDLSTITWNGETYTKQ